MSGAGVRFPVSRSRLALLACGMMACGAPGHAASPHAPAPLTCSARVVHVNGTTWRAEYTFSEPVGSFTFRGRPHPFREGWRLAPPLRLVHEGEKHVVISPSPRRSFVLDITATDEQPDKDYRPFDVFTDRGTLLYTGHFALDLPGHLVVAAAEGEAVLVQGHPRAKEATLAMGEDGTYAYVGGLPPVETRDVTAVVDRGYPPWLRSEIDSLLPPLFATLTTAFGGGAARGKPLLFARFGRHPGKVRDLGGGVVHPGVVALGFGLGDELLREPEALLRQDIELVIAHEIVHLWNTDRFEHVGDASTAWMYEGSADALAFRLLATLGIYDEATRRERVSTALSLCLLALAEGSSLRASVAPGRSRDFYTCGATAALVTEAAVRSRLPEADLLTFWRALFDATAPRGGRYDEALYLATLARLSADREATSVVDTLTRGRLDDPERTLTSTLARLGVRTDRRPNGGILLPPTYEAKAGPFAVRALLPPACAAALAFRGNHAAHPQVTSDACAPLARGDVVVSLAEIDVGAEGARAWDAAFLACARDGRVRIGRKDAGPLDVPCASVPRARPAYVDVSAGSGARR